MILERIVLREIDTEPNTIKDISNKLNKNPIISFLQIQELPKCFTSGQVYGITQPSFNQLEIKEELSC